MEAVVRALVTKPAAVMEAVALVILDLGELMRPQRDEWLSAALQSPAPPPIPHPQSLHPLLVACAVARLDSAMQRPGFCALMGTQ